MARVLEAVSVLVVLILYVASAEQTITKETKTTHDLETRLQRLQDDLVSTRMQMEFHLQQMSAENRRLREDLAEMRNVIKHRNSDTDVYFTAYLTSQIYNYTGTLRPFTTVTNVGGGFNDTTGVFQAPVDGIYLFVASGTTFYGDAVYSSVNMGLVLEGGVVSTALAKSRGGYAMGTVQATLRLSKGQRVWLGSLDDLSLYEDHSTGFTGVLLRADSY